MDKRTVNELPGRVGIYLSPAGSDEGNGTKDAPFKTIERAREAARAVDKSQPGETVVFLRGGTYSIGKTIEFDARDSGTEDHPVVYRAWPGERPVISGGKVLGGWEKAGNTLYKAPVGEMDFRQIYVDGRKGQRSRYPKAGEYLPLVEWDEENREIILPLGSLRDWQDFDEVEIHLQMQWSIAIMRLESFRDHTDGLALAMKNPERDLVFAREFPQKHSGQYFHFENSREFIDQPGEWCIDRQGGVCHYRPRPGEDMESVRVVVPQVETLLAIRGTLDDPVRHMRFEGLVFEHANWTRPSQLGYLNVQAGQYSIEPTEGNTQYVERPPSAVDVACAHNLVFRRNEFTKLGSTALDLCYGTRECEVVGNVFHEISGTAVSHAMASDPDVMIHVPYNPPDERELCVNDRIHNNYITRVGYDNGGCVGIFCGYSTAVVVEHNELFDLAYSGISLGWGWTKEPNAMRDNIVRCNRIERPLTLFSDGAGIYTLSEMPGSLIQRNFVDKVPRSKWADPHTTNKCFYYDEGSGGITLDHNLSGEYAKGVERDFFNWPGKITMPSSAYSPELYRELVDRAGLEPEYRDITEALASRRNE